MPIINFVGFVGRVGCGKSAVINRLVGKSILPTRCTVGTVITPQSGENGFTVHALDKHGSCTTVSHATAAQVKAGIKSPSPSTKVIRVYGDFGRLITSGTIIDTPDYRCLFGDALALQCRTIVLVVDWRDKDWPSVVADYIANRSLHGRSYAYERPCKLRLADYIANRSLHGRSYALCLTGAPTPGTEKKITEVKEMMPVFCLPRKGNKDELEFKALAAFVGRNLK
jgi:hypothetical protein